MKILYCRDCGYSDDAINFPYYSQETKYDKDKDEYTIKGCYVPYCPKCNRIDIRNAFLL